MSDYVYNYGDGNKVVYLDEDDSVNLSSDTSAHLVGIDDGEDYRTVFVFDDYSVLNVVGRVGDVVVNGETIIHHDSIDIDTSSLENTDITSFNTEIYVTTDDVVDLNELGITADKIRGIQQVNDYRTLVVYDNYNSLNMYGRVGDVILDGQTIVHHDPIEGENWGDSEDYIEAIYAGSGILFVDEDDTIDLSGVTQNDIRGIKINDDSSMFVFNDYSGFQAYGRASQVVIGEETYAINYDNHSLNLVSSSTSTEA